jgi:hypothetical protein
MVRLVADLLGRNREGMVTFAAGLILGGCVGAFCGFLLACILIAAKHGDEQLARTSSGPYGISERMSKAARALEREGYIEHPMGHPRLGIDHPKRGAARLHPPTP